MAGDYSTLPGITVRGSFYLTRDRSALALRSTLNSGSTDREGLGLGAMFGNTHGEAALMLGRVRRYRHGFTAALIGPAVTWSAYEVGENQPCGFDCDTAVERTGPHLGVAGEVGYHSTMFGVVGVALVLHGTVTTETPFVGVTAGFSLGR